MSLNQEYEYSAVFCSVSHGFPRFLTRDGHVISNCVSIRYARWRRSLRRDWCCLVLRSRHVLCSASFFKISVACCVPSGALGTVFLAPPAGAAHTFTGLFFFYFRKGFTGLRLPWIWKTSQVTGIVALIGCPHKRHPQPAEQTRPNDLDSLPGEIARASLRGWESK